jgi:serine/threonine protein kinase
MLGKGNFASVYDAQCKKTGKWYAVKTVDKRTVLESKRNIVRIPHIKY